MYFECIKSSQSPGFIEAHKRYFVLIMLASKSGPGIYEHPVDVNRRVECMCLIPMWIRMAQGPQLLPVTDFTTRHITLLAASQPY